MGTVASPSKATPRPTGSAAEDRGGHGPPDLTRLPRRSLFAWSARPAPAGPPWRLRRRTVVPRGPHNAAADPHGLSAAVTSPPADRVTILNPGGGVRRSVRVQGSPHDVRYMPDGRRLWVTVEQGQRIVQLGAARGGIRRSVRVGGRPHDLAISPDGRRLWITIDGRRTVEQRDARSGRLIGIRRPGGMPHDLAFRGDDDEVWLSNWDSGSLTVASSRTGQPLAQVAAGAEPHHFAFGLGSVWATDNGGGELVRIAPGRRRVLSRTRVGREPHHVTVAGRAVLVAVNGTGRVAVASRRGRVVDVVRVGGGPHGIAAFVRRTPVKAVPGRYDQWTALAAGRRGARARVPTAESPARPQALCRTRTGPPYREDAPRHWSPPQPI